MSGSDVHRARAGTAWVPAACTLPTAEQPLRVAEFDELFAHAVRAPDRREPGWLRVHLGGGTRVETDARRLAAAETSCCSFFDFRITPVAEGPILDVRVPETQAAVLDAIARQVDAARRHADSGATG